VTGDAVHGAASFGVVDDKVLDLFVDQRSQVRVDDLVAVTVADDQAVAVGYREAGHVVALFRRHGWCLEWAQVEENRHLGRGDEFHDEIAEDWWHSRAVFVEENPEASHGADGAAAVLGRELDGAVGLLLDKVGRWEAVCGFGGPLPFFAESPQDEERREDTGQGQREPRAIGNLCQSG